MTASEIILKYAPQDGVVGVGVSGGADSMVLLTIAIQTLGAERIEVLHIEHGIRGEESLSDAKFVEDYCKKAGVKFSLFKADIPSLSKENKRSEESEARIFRHAVYSDFAQKHSTCVLLGHHKDDRKESILMHILRGCAIGGLVGMTEKDGHIVRPLINMSKAQIEEFARENGIEYVTDSTNFQTVYNRNYVRSVLIPAIDERYDSDALLRLSDSARENEEFMSKFVNTERIIEDDGAYLIPLDCFSDKAVASRYVLKAFALAGFSYDMESKHIGEVCSLVSLENGSRISLPHSYEASKEYGFIAVYKQRESVTDEEEFALGFTPFLFGTVIVSQTDELPRKGKLVFDADKIPYGAVIRTRREGDVFKPYGGKTKKLKEYFIDKKIPLRKRDFIPLVASGNEILIIADLEVSDKIKVDERTSEKYEFVYEK